MLRVLHLQLFFIEISRFMLTCLVADLVALCIVKLDFYMHLQLHLACISIIVCISSQFFHCISSSSLNALKNGSLHSHLLRYSSYHLVQIHILFAFTLALTHSRDFIIVVFGRAHQTYLPILTHQQGPSWVPLLSYRGGLRDSFVGCFELQNSIKHSFVPFIL